MNTNVDEFRYLWDGSEPDWALLKFFVPSEDEPSYIIVDTKDKSTLLISDDSLYDAVIETMLDKKVCIVSSI